MSILDRSYTIDIGYWTNLIAHLDGEKNLMAKLKSKNVEECTLQIGQLVAKAVRPIIEKIPEEDRGEVVKEFKAKLFEPLYQPCPTPAEQELADEMSGMSFSIEESLLINANSVLKSFARRTELLQGSFTVSKVQKLFSYKARQSVIDRINNKTLLGVKQCGKWKLPSWQFDSSKEYGVIDGLVDTIKALNISNLGKVSWLTLPNPHLEGLTPIEMLESGYKEEVIEEANGVGISQ